jgi:predicted DNA-binding transcriptional regulator YafY
MALFLSARRRVLARDVAQKFGISLRTVYRDMQALQHAGFPVEGNAGDGYRLPQTSYLRPLQLSADEAEALTLAASALSASASARVREALTRATLKLESVLDSAARQRVLALGQHIVVSDIGQRSELSDEVLTSLRERRVARIRYRDPRTGAQTQRSIESLGLVCVGGAFWLVAYCRLRRDARAFRLDSIEHFRLLAEVHALRPGLSFTEVIARDAHLAQALFGS